MPLQKPHPRIFIPGVASRETVVWAAEQGYPYIGLNTNAELNTKIKAIYKEAANRVGYEPGPEQFGMLLQCHVADTAEKAERNAQEFMWMRGEFTGLTHPIWGTPTGYGSPSNRQALIEISAGRRPPHRPPTMDERKRQRTMVYGTPDQVTEQLKQILEVNRLSILCLWANRRPHQPRRLEVVYPAARAGGSCPPSVSTPMRPVSKAPSSSTRR